MDDGTERFLELLTTVRQRPFMYLYNRESPYMALVDYISGYFAGMLPNNAGNWEGGFNEWIWKSKAEKGLLGERNLGWQGIIASSFPTEQERFENFFVLLDEYLAYQR
jgi:hypothetical protein